jgi:flagellar basal body P-ring formation protein FlgA
MPLSSARVVDAARAAVDAKLGATKSSAIVSVIGHPDDLRVPEGTTELKARVTTGNWPRTRVSVPVDVYVAGRLTSTTAVWFSLSLPSSGPGYAAAYPAGTDIGTLSLSSVNSDAAAVQGVVASLPSNGVPMRLRRGVRAGEPLRSDDFEPWPDVVRGEHVQVAIQSGSLRLTAQAVAIGSGSRGEKVNVMVDGAEAAVQAEVTGKGEVRVAL